MNDQRYSYEDFSSSSPSPEADASGPALSEDQRLEAYETGFKAGWDDANAAMTEGAAAVETAATQTLSDLSFTLAEAKAHTLAALRPLMEQLASNILPAVAQSSLAPLIVEKVLAVADTSMDTQLSLRIAPEDRSSIEDALEGHCELPLRLIDEATLMSGQANLDLGAIEHQIDLPALTAEIQAAVSDFYSLQPNLSEEHADAV
ncbi:flagellar biosynthesis protein [Cognatishimia sp. MH4019]|uniref:flagellar biosynthesis protein n=1 Tax=Cognatishimia sp. MH4019 TaxID=2854030 RepID=UPI001CD2C35F|nr:flagellar biosynthesis protein [Cognatishimia sp. MH4019]